MQMMKHPWKIYKDNELVAQGHIEAETHREAMGMVLLENANDKDPDTLYTIKVNDSVTTSYGDEFERSASAIGWDKEPEEMGGSHLFEEPSKFFDGGLVDPQNHQWIGQASNPMEDIRRAKRMVEQSNCQHLHTIDHAWNHTDPKLDECLECGAVIPRVEMNVRFQEALQRIADSVIPDMSKCMDTFSESMKESARTYEKLKKHLPRE